MATEAKRPKKGIYVFTQSLKEKYPCFVNGKKDQEVECNICHCSVSFANGGRLHF